MTEKSNNPDPLQAAISAAQQESIAANMARWIAFRGIAAGEWIELCEARREIEALRRRVEELSARRGA